MSQRLRHRLHHLRQFLRQAAADPRAARLRLHRAVRAGVGMARGMLGYHIAWHSGFRRRDKLSAAVADLLMIGFYGAHARSPSARLLARQIRRGEVGSVFFVTQNIGTREEVAGLLQLFREGEADPIIAIDHEGGIVQRLKEAHGVTRLPSAKVISETLSPAAARELYGAAGRELAALGFTLNLGPVLDIDVPGNPVIANPKRSYGTDPERIASYCEAFCGGFAEAGVLCAAKHFPGHGSSESDSHYGIADISTRWSEAELEPFTRLFASPDAPACVMMGHLRLERLAPDGEAATLAAPIVTGLLRERLGYKGVVMTDDVDMDAISCLMSRREAVVRALAAGNDLIMIKNLFGYDPLLPQRVVRWVRKAVAEGQLSEVQIMASAARVREMRRQIASKAQQGPKT